MKIHKYTNILKVISLNYNPYNSCNHFSKSWGCKILCVYMQFLVFFIVNTPISIDQGLHVSTIQKQGRHIISMPQSRRDYNNHIDNIAFAFAYVIKHSGIQRSSKAHNHLWPWHSQVMEIESHFHSCNPPIYLIFIYWHYVLDDYA
jgi:hypothetical protein